MIKKKVFAVFLLCLSIVFSSSVFAESGVAEISADIEEFQLYNVDDELCDYIYAALKNRDASIDVSALSVTKEQLRDAFTQIHYNYADMFYVSSSYEYSLSHSTQKVSNVFPKYLYSEEETKQYTELLNCEIKKAAAAAEASMSEIEKILAVHDYFCSEFEYDTSLNNRTALSLFQTKKGVCQAYAYAFKAVMDEIGIGCRYVVSESMNHMWNVVKVDGKWYHVDVTWDDPVPDKAGMALHSNFLKTDSEMALTGHSDWVSEESVSDAPLENAFWNEVNIPLCYKDGEWIKISGSSIAAYNYQTNSERIIYTISDKWKVWNDDNYVYLDCYSSVLLYGGEIYFNTPDKICKINDEGNKIDVYSADTSEGYIYGMGFLSDKKGDKIMYVLSTAPNEEGNMLEFVLKKGGSTAVLSDGMYCVNAEFPKVAEGCTAVFASYDLSGKLIEMKEAKVTGGKAEVLMQSKSVDKICTFCFENLTSIMPVTDLYRASVK